MKSIDQAVSKQLPLFGRPVPDLPDKQFRRAGISTNREKGIEYGSV